MTFAGRCEILSPRPSLPGSRRAPRCSKANFRPSAAVDDDLGLNVGGAGAAGRGRSGAAEEAAARPHGTLLGLG